MIATEQANKLIDDFITIVVRATTSPNREDRAAIVEAKNHIVALLTGSSRIDRKAVALDTDTQLCEAIDPKKETERIERSRILSAGFQNLFDELILRQQRIHEVLTHYVGCTPDKLIVRARDLLHMTVDLGQFMLAMNGSWAEVVTKIEADEKERRERTKFATRSMEDEAKPMIVAKQAKAEVDSAPEAAKG